MHFESKGYLWTHVEKDFFAEGENKANSLRPRCKMEEKSPNVIKSLDPVPEASLYPDPLGVRTDHIPLPPKLL